MNIAVFLFSKCEVIFLLLFVDQEITFDRFKVLRKDLIAELIPKLGPRSEFITNWEQKFGQLTIDDERSKRRRSSGIRVSISALSYL